MLYEVITGRGYCADYAAERLYRDVRVGLLMRSPSSSSSVSSLRRFLKSSFETFV